MFRLLENDNSLLQDKDGNILTDSYLSHGNNEGEFSFIVTNDTGNIENISLRLEKGIKPIIPPTFYIYHTFNQDYVDRNIRELDYIKNADDQNMQGFILGKAHIDVSEDKEKLEELGKVGKTKQEDIINFINQYKNNNISKIPNITRLNEYKELEASNIIKGHSKYSLDKNIDEYIQDYDKIKSVPENLESVPEILFDAVNFEKVLSIKEMLEREFSLSSFSEDFKIKIKEKQEFIEKGLSLSKDGKCPFCETPYNSDALKLVDIYTKYVNDQESKTIKVLDENRKFLNNVVSYLKEKEKETDKQTKIFNDYKTKYFASLEEEELHEVDVTSVKQLIEKLVHSISEKINNISVPQIIQDQSIENLKIALNDFRDKISKNNEIVKSMNQKITRVANENKEIRKNICRATFEYLLESQKTDIEELMRIFKEYNVLQQEIAKKEEAMRTLKKKEVANTIKQVLSFFFDKDKYTLDEETFQLVFKHEKLDRGNVKFVLSEGEKNIIAFAYYLGDTHIKISRDNDYKKLFFIIDDPISSLDFNHVYTVSGIIRKLKDLFPLLVHPRFVLLTHNNEFMRIISSNKIVDKRLLLQNGQLVEFNINFTVPYISHLLDVFRVARRGQAYSHTTANSIRHIMETLVKFRNIELSDDGIDRYIQDNFNEDVKSYTFINDLSHGGWRTEAEPLLPKDCQEVCESLIRHIEKLFPNQIAYCDKNA